MVNKSNRLSYLCSDYRTRFSDLDSLESAFDNLTFDGILAYCSTLYRYVVRDAFFSLSVAQIKIPDLARNSI